MRNINQVSFPSDVGHFAMSLKYTIFKSSDKGWFHFSKSTLLPTITHCDQLLHTLSTVTSIDLLMINKSPTAAQNVVTKTISLAKVTWSSYQADRVHAMKFTPKDAMKSVTILVGDKESHHDNPVVMRMRLPTVKLATTDAKNASILTPQFEGVYTAHRPIYWDTLDYIHQKDIIFQIDEPIEWDKFMQAICKLVNEKSPSLKEVPPYAFKTLSNQNSDILFSFLTAYWQNKIDFTEWHEGRVVLVPKSGNLSDPKK